MCIIPILAAPTRPVPAEELINVSSELRAQTIYHSTTFQNSHGMTREGAQSCWGPDSSTLHCTTSKEQATERNEGSSEWRGIVRFNSYLLGFLV